LTFRAKQRSVFAFLLILAAWPLVHRGLVQAYRIDPWSFGGWAMYCTPRLDLRIGASAYRGGRPLGVPVPGSVGSYAVSFGERRMYFGRFVTPDDLAERVLEAMPAADAVGVLIERRTLDPRTARIRSDVEEYRHEREAGGVVGLGSRMVEGGP
jgi:hypothetical protein